MKPLHHDAKSSIWRELVPTLRLAVPIIASQLLQNALSVLDIVMVGRVSVDAVAACAFACNIFVLPLLFGFGFLGAIPVLVANAHGRGSHAETRAVLVRGTFFSLGLAILATLAVIVISANLGLFRQPAIVTEQARPFLILLGWSILPVFIGQSIKQYCEALHAAWPPMLILCLGLPVNAALNYVFIYGHFGWPALGLVGAGWATLITRTFMLILLALYVWLFLWKTSAASEEQTSAASSENIYAEMLRIGLPAGLQVLLEVGFFTAASIMMGWISDRALAAHQIAISVASTTFMVPLGLAIAISIRVSHSYGQGHLHQTRSIARAGLIFSVIFMAAASLLICLFPAQIAKFFVRDAEVVHIATQILLIAGAFQICDGLQTVSMGGLRGIKDVTIPTVLILCGYWLLCLPLSYYLAFTLGYGAIGVWLGILAGLILISAALLWRLETMMRRLVGP